MDNGKKKSNKKPKTEAAPAPIVQTAGPGEVIYNDFSKPGTPNVALQTGKGKFVNKF